MTPRMRISFYFLCLALIILPHTPKVLAQHFTSPSYIIDWGNFNITSGKKSSTNYNLTDTVGQNAPGQYNSTGFIVKSGFQYIYDGQNQFSFRINDLTIDLGTLVPNIGSSDTNIITISSPAGHGYEIYAQENHPLWIRLGKPIPDTLCDSGTCSQSVSGVWTSASAYGFGFNAIGINTSGVSTGVGTSSIFPNSTYFRQFADTSSSEKSEVIMTESSPVKDHSARITYKVNISPLQAAGNYQNSVIFTAVPKY